MGTLARIMRALRAGLGRVPDRDMNTQKRPVQLSFCLIAASLLGCFKTTEAKLNDMITFCDKFPSGGGESDNLCGAIGPVAA